MNARSVLKVAVDREADVIAPVTFAYPPIITNVPSALAVMPEVVVPPTTDRPAAVTKPLAVRLPAEMVPVTVAAAAVRIPESCTDAADNGPAEVKPVAVDMTPRLVRAPTSASPVTLALPPAVTEPLADRLSANIVPMTTVELAVRVPDSDAKPAERPPTAVKAVALTGADELRPTAVRGPESDAPTPRIGDETVSAPAVRLTTVVLPSVTAAAESAEAVTLTADRYPAVSSPAPTVTWFADSCPVTVTLLAVTAFGVEIAP